MLHYAIVILGVGALCAGWALLQLFIVRRDPESNTIFDRGCGRARKCDGGDCGGERCRTHPTSVPEPK